MSVRALIVGVDNPATSNTSALLAQASYEVVTARTGAAGVRACSGSLRPAIVLISGELGDMAGTELCRQLRQSAWTSKIPIVILSEQAADIDRVVAFELGADDYVTIPYDERELLYRLRAILRRCYPDRIDSLELSVGELTLDRDGHRVRLDGKTLSLTRVEFQLLEVLMTRRGRGQPRERLLEDVWGRCADGNVRTVDTHIRRLRQKLGEAARYIQTVRGVGYRFGERDELDE